MELSLCICKFINIKGSLGEELHIKLNAIHFLSPLLFTVFHLKCFKLLYLVICDLPRKVLKSCVDSATLQ